MEDRGIEFVATRNYTVQPETADTKTMKSAPSSNVRFIFPITIHIQINRMSALHNQVLTRYGAQTDPSQNSTCTATYGQTVPHAK